MWSAIAFTVGAIAVAVGLRRARQGRDTSPAFTVAALAYAVAMGIMIALHWRR